jgi:hypothetical protein
MAAAADAAAASAASSSSSSSVASSSTATGSSHSNSSLMAGLFLDAGEAFGETSSIGSVFQSPGGTTESSSSDLLLLDQAWADLDSRLSDDSDESLFDDESDDAVCTQDLALAAVLKDEDEWWNTV